MATYTTNAANLAVREIGISLFLASVGLTAGGTFVDSLVAGNGLLYVGIGFIITFVPQILVGVISRLFLKMNYHTILGLLIGACTNSPILAYAALDKLKKGTQIVNCSLAHSSVWTWAVC